VALKLPRPLLQTDPVLRRMFENEVQITLGLDHPNVVRAFEGYARRATTRSWRSSTARAARSTSGCSRRGGCRWRQGACGWCTRSRWGWQHTHERRVLHRDVKPANVFLDGDGHAKLGDFGTGTFQSDDAERVGTAFYMAPEVFEGSPTSVRSDVYSLGVLAYEVLAGERPFVGSTYDALMVAHLHSLPRDLRAVRPELPPAVPRVVARAMSREPDRRFQDVASFLVAYREAIGVATPAAEVAPADPTPTLGRDGVRRSAVRPPAPDAARRRRRTGRRPRRAPRPPLALVAVRAEAALTRRRGGWPLPRNPESRTIRSPPTPCRIGIGTSPS
jgi:eukaryotic-like serine/threonine-protein kinase